MYNLASLAINCKEEEALDAFFHKSLRTWIREKPLWLANKDQRRSNRVLRYEYKVMPWSLRVRHAKYRYGLNCLRLPYGDIRKRVLIGPGGKRAHLPVRRFPGGGRRPTWLDQIMCEAGWSADGKKYVLNYQTFLRDLGCTRAKRSATKKEIKSSKLNVDDTFPPEFLPGMEPLGDPASPENYCATPIFPRELNNDEMSHEVAQNAWSRLQRTGDDAVPESGILNRKWVAQVLVEAEDDLDNNRRSRHLSERLAVKGRGAGDSLYVEPLKIFQELPLSVKFHPLNEPIVAEEECKRRIASLSRKMQGKNHVTTRSSSVS